MNFKRTRALMNRLRGKKTATGLPINSKGKTPNGTPIMGVNKNGKPVTTNAYVYNRNKNNYNYNNPQSIA